MGLGFEYWLLDIMFKIKNIIFDWSGTLCDDFKISYISTCAILRKFGGSTISIQDYKKHFTLPAWKFYRRSLRGIPMDRLERDYFDHFSKTANRAKLYKETPAILKKAGKLKIKLFIFSTVRDSLLKDLCRQKRISPYFNSITGSVRDKEKSLPRFLKKHGLKPKETIYIGDMDHDITAAKKSGVYSGVLLCGYHADHRLLKLNPDFAWNNHKSLIKFLR